MHVLKRQTGSKGERVRGAQTSGFARTQALALISSLVLACGAVEEQKSPLSPYASATLTAGVGLGDLELGRTTLGSVVQRLGVETVTPLASEQVGLELFYEHGQLALLFLIEPSCLDKLKTGLRPAAANMNAFLARNPCVREATLASLSVRSGKSVDESFYKGATDAGAKLWDPIEAASKHGESCAGPKAPIAGLNLDNPENEVHFKPGITFYHRALEGAGPGQTRIQRITIYPKP